MSTAATVDHAGRENVQAPRAGILVEGTPAVVVPVPHPYWTLARAAAALGPLLRTGPRLEHRPLAGVSTDTRTIERGSLFVALRGERFDAHTMLGAARDAGAAAVVIDDPAAAAGLGLPALVVSDTLAALGALGTAWRRAWGRPVVAVGGSNGKTTTKDLLRAALGAGLRVHATHGNLNNLVGVPLTLLGIPADADVAVVEVGTNQHGEVRQLRAICEPDVVVITSIGEEHLEGLGDLAGVLAEESALCDNVPLAVVPAWHPELVAEARRRARAVHVVSRATSPRDDDGPPPDLVASASGVRQDGRAWLIVNETTIMLPLRGVHQAGNALLALAVAQVAGVPWADATRALETMPVPAMRGTWETIGSLTVINDAYNANPPSVRASLALLSDLEPGRQRVAVLGTMRELGGQAAAQHVAVARTALESPADLIVAVGDFVSAFTELGADSKRVLMVEHADDVWPALAPHVQRDAIILLKGSRGVRLERVLPSLTAWATA